MSNQRSLASLLIGPLFLLFVSVQKGEYREEKVREHKLKSWFYFPCISTYVLSQKVRTRGKQGNRGH